MNYVEDSGRIYFHPGYYIGELLRCSDITKNDLIDGSAITEDKLYALIDARTPVDQKTAERLSEVTGTSVMYWLNLQNEWNKHVTNEGGK